MTRLENYLEDGADHQARATLMFLQRNGGNIEESWNDEWKRYDAEIQVGRWENSREQGYVVSLRNKKLEQLNIAFFEHRNTDDICSVKWQQVCMNTPTIDSAKFGDVYKDKYDTSHSVGYGKAYEMAEWIIKQLTEHWVKAFYIYKTI
tara:strand:- start:54 stop:497 length:444 start_codon:yes stop_codon:yes gene_type:complete